MDPLQWEKFLRMKISRLSWQRIICKQRPLFKFLKKYLGINLEKATESRDFHQLLIGKLTLGPDWSKKMERQPLFNSFTARAIYQKRNFYDILDIFSPGMSQISTNLLKKTFTSFLSTSPTFYDTFAQACAEIKISRFSGEKVTYVFSSSSFSPFLFILFLSFYGSD